MICPVDQTQLAISNRDGIEIDYCPNCRGVWLDRGELDKLIDRAQSYMQPQRDYDNRDRYDDRRDNYRLDDDDDDHRRRDDRHYDDHDHRKKHKKESMFGDLFDFG